jgi:AcrR family transcriptional regulator
MTTLELPSESDGGKPAESGALSDSPRCRADQRRARRREKFLDAAIETIRTIGADATMADLAAGAGVSKPVLYTHFGDRLGLTTAVMARLGEIFEAERQANSGERQPELSELIESFVRFVEQDPEIFRWALRGTPDHSTLLAECLAATIQGRQLHNIIETAVDDGTPETADVTSLAIAGFAVAAVDLWLARHAISRDDLVTHLSRFIANGLESQHP